MHAYGALWKITWAAVADLAALSVGGIAASWVRGCERQNVR